MSANDAVLFYFGFGMESFCNPAQEIAPSRKRSTASFILACTDLQILVPKHEGVEIYDTMEILAQATVKNILE